MLAMSAHLVEGRVPPVPDERPLYGSFSSPEEQARRRGADAEPPVPGHEDSPRLDPALYSHRAPGEVPAPSAVKKARPADRVITIALLVYALMTIVVMTGGLINLSDSLISAWDMVGVEGEFTNFASAKTAGAVASIILIVGFVVTAFLSIRRVKRQRTSWWVPLVGGAITWILVYICIAVPLLGDPAFIEYATNMGR